MRIRPRADRCARFYGPPRPLPIETDVKRWASLTVPLCLVNLLAATGCSLRNDPHYNRFAPARDRPHLARRADSGVTAAERSLDNGGQRLDNIID